MNIWLLIAIVVLFIVWKMWQSRGITQLNTAQYREMKNNKEAIFIDVRTPAEYNQSHKKPFVNMPLGSNFSTLPKDKPIVVVCQSGMRSMAACKQLKKLGYTTIYNIRGGQATIQGD